jgi:hypothetical protein
LLFVSHTNTGDLLNKSYKVVTGALRGVLATWLRVYLRSSPFRCHAIRPQPNAPRRVRPA